LKPLRFGIRYDLRNPARWRRPWRTHYGQLLGQAALADQWGFHSIWLSEHHFTEDGYCPAVLSLLGNLAARTERARLGTFILLLPLYHPLRLAEEIAALDIISDGRIDLGIAAGYRPEEFRSHGIPVGERGTRMEQGIEILRQAWTQERITHHGRHYSFDALPVEPKPLQKPHPPMWMGGESPAAIRRAVKYDCHFMPTTTGHTSIPAFRREVAAQSKSESDFSIALPRVIYVTDDPEEGWNELKDHLLYQHNVYCQWAVDAGMLRPDGGVVLDTPERLPRHQYLIGDAQTCIAALEALQAELNVDEITLWAVLPGFDIDKATRSLERFANQVIPHFQAKQT
jgi:probable F420-dependent oxidoreductase